MKEVKVVSSARKLILRPEPKRTKRKKPEGFLISDYGVNNENPSLWVINRTEDPPTVQGVSYATGVVIINQVEESIAESALRVYATRGIDAAISLLSQSGYTDQYTTPLSFVDEKLSKSGKMLDDYNGIVKRDDRDLVTLRIKNNGFFVVHEGQERQIRRDILLKTYRWPQGGYIDDRNLEL